MDAVRSFIAIALSERTIADVDRWTKKIHAPLGHFQWTAPANYHLTLAFLGDVDMERVPEVFAATGRAAANLQPFSISFDGWGAFPNAHRPSVLWLGVGAGRAETLLAYEALLAELEPIGFPREDRAFTPHLTIARAGRRHRPKPLPADLRVPALSTIAASAADAFCVMASDLTPRGPVYSVTTRCAFGSA